jgi:RNA polymerase sigma-70 factor (ECF subfamily)
MTGETDIRHGLFIAHRAALVDYATRIVRSRETAEDIVQEAYLRFNPEQVSSLSSRQHLAYLYRTVRNLAYDLIKRRRIEMRDSADDLPFWTQPQSISTPEQAALLADEVQTVARVLRSMPSDMRTALELYRFGGAKLEEVGAHLGVSVATTHRLVRSAMMRIAAALDRNLH